MNVVDIILLCLIAGAAINGFIKGFFVELASVLSLVLGMWSAVKFSERVGDWLSHFLNWSSFSIRLISFILIFIFVVIIVHLVAALTEKFFSAIALGLLSRLAGAVFGALKAIFILSILMLILNRIESFTITLVPAKVKAESRFYSKIEQIAPNIFPFLKSEEDQDQENKPSGKPAV